MRTTAQLLEGDCTQKGASLGTRNNAFQTRGESNCCSHETLLRTRAELYCLGESTFLDELSIAFAHCYPILRHIRLNL